MAGLETVIDRLSEGENRKSPRRRSIRLSHGDISFNVSELRSFDVYEMTTCQQIPRSGKATSHYLLRESEEALNNALVSVFH